MVDSNALAREAGSMLATNMVMVGAAASSLPIDVEVLKSAIGEIFASKGQHVVDVNLKAFKFGQEA